MPTAIANQPTFFSLGSGENPVPASTKAASLWKMDYRHKFEVSKQVCTQQIS